MLDSVDHVIISVEDLDEASKNYEMILGNPPVWKGEHKEFGTKNTLFNFQNTYLELLAADGEGIGCLLYTSPSPRDQRGSRMPSSA